jgi:hypothetical protein
MAESKLSLTAAFQTLSNAGSTTEHTIQAEIAADPLSRWTLDEIKALSESVEKTLAYLIDEEELFSGTASLDDLKEEELKTMLSDIKESSRKLSIVLGGGLNQFTKSSVGADILTVLNNLASYFSPKLSMLDVKGLVAFYSRQNAVQLCPYGCGIPLNQCGHWHQYHGHHQQAKVAFPFTLNLQPEDLAHSGKSGTQQLKSLAKMATKFSGVLDKMVESREADEKQRMEKPKSVKMLESGAEKLAPLLKMHAIRVGLGKGQHLNISQGCVNVNTLYNQFEYSTVENAHRQVEDARDLIQQELVIRRLRAEPKSAKKRARGH